MSKLRFVACEGKGDKDRHALLPDAVATNLQQHLTRVRASHPRDLEACRVRWTPDSQGGSPQVRLTLVLLLAQCRLRVIGFAINPWGDRPRIHQNIFPLKKLR